MQIAMPPYETFLQTMAGSLRTTIHFSHFSPLAPPQVYRTQTFRTKRHKICGNAEGRDSERQTRHAALSRTTVCQQRRFLRVQAAQVNGSSTNVSIVLLAGGSGKRMGAPIPKQYLELAGQPLAMYSLQEFARMPEVNEIVVVCNPEYRGLFEEYYTLLQRKPRLEFAEPGGERQDSVYNGFQAISKEAALVAIHDSARPLISAEDTRACIQDANQVGAAVLGVPVKPTIKEIRPDGTVVKTLKRANLWEVQTPQIIRPDLLKEGFELIRRENLEVTDDVSIIEALGKPVKLTKGSYTNIKVTTPDDISVAEGFLKERGSPIDVAAIA